MSSIQGPGAPPPSHRPIVSDDNPGVTGPTGTTPAGPADPNDGVDAAPGTPPPATPPGPPTVEGNTNFDQGQGEGTMGDVKTVADALATGDGSSSADLETALAKMLVAIGGLDQNQAEELIKLAKDRAESDKAKTEKMMTDMAELNDLAKEASGPCSSNDRVEQKLEEMGYSPDEAEKMASDMSDGGGFFGTSSGDRAILILEAVENAPEYQAKDAEGVPPLDEKGAVDGDNKKFAAELMMILLGAYDGSLDTAGTGDSKGTGKAATPQTPAQPGGVQV